MYKVRQKLQDSFSGQTLNENVVFDRIIHLLSFAWGPWVGNVGFTPCCLVKEWVGKERRDVGKGGRFINSEYV